MGLPWYYVGIGGTVVLIILYVITRMPNNPIFGRAGPIEPPGTAIEISQAAFIGLTAVIIIYENKRKRHGKATSEKL
jgi:hypothetical protein